MASRAQVLLLYRQILVAAKRFPSVKRAAIVEDIRLEFREAAPLSDAAEVARRVAVGARSLGQLRAYAGMDAGAPEAEVFLKGPCE